jgi:prepilin-type N-terminal cleavage/methylation domain-containing protein
MRLRSRRGVTLSELMVAMVILTVGVLAGMSSFRYISTAISQSRLKTIATNLAQEKMEVLKNKSYFLVLVTTQTASSSGFTPDFVYDVGNYAPDIITLWGLPPLTRVVNVDYAAVSGTTVSTVTFTSNDTGMKKISVIVYWTERSIPKQVRVDSYYENPSVATLSTGFTGTVGIVGGGALGRALVQVVGAPKWRAYTDAAGAYSFQVAPGSYTLTASSSGFASVGSGNISVTEGVYQPWSPSLIRIASGTVGADSVYAVDPSLVISQVAVSSVMVNADNMDIEYVELFNPTTHQIDIANVASPPGTAPAASRYITLGIASTDNPHPRECDNIELMYVSTYVAAGWYYLIANTYTFVNHGTVFRADAYYTDNAGDAGTCSPTPPPSPNDWQTGHLPQPYKRIMQYFANGAVWINDASGNVLDAVGWRGASSPPQCETSCIPTPTNNGILQGDQIVRFYRPGVVGDDTYGRAYDSNQNLNDFYYNNTGSSVGQPYHLFNSTTTAPAAGSGRPATIISGRPSTGTFIFADDGNSAGVLSTDIAVAGAQGQSCHDSSFTLVGVATGTWTVAAIWSGSSGTVTNVQVATAPVTKITNGSTVPTWPAANLNYVSLPYPYTGGVAAGLVFGAGPEFSLRLGPSQGGIKVGSSYGNYTWTDNQGWYALSVPTGTATITANLGSTNANYISSDYDVTVTAGGMTDVPDFHLAKGATLKGYVTAGSGGLPNIPIDASNGPVYEDTSDSTGYFYIFVATSPVAYSVAPLLDASQSYSAAAVAPATATGTGPLSVTAATAGSTVFIGTFTIIGGMGTIKGHVTYNSKPITTGVLILASVAAPADPPARVVASSAPAQTPVYSVTSQADGTYTLEVRQSTTTGYSMRAFYPAVDIKTGAVSYPGGGSKTIAPFAVWAGTEYPNKDFVWPYP